MAYDLSKISISPETELEGYQMAGIPHGEWGNLLAQRLQSINLHPNPTGEPGGYPTMPPPRNMGLANLGATEAGMEYAPDEFVPSGAGQRLSNIAQSGGGGFMSPAMSFAGELMQGAEERRKTQASIMQSHYKKNLLKRVEKEFAKLQDGTTANDDDAITALRKMSFESYNQVGTDFNIGKILDSHIEAKFKNEELAQKKTQAEAEREQKLTIANQTAQIQRDKLEAALNNPKLSDTDKVKLASIYQRINTLTRLISVGGVVDEAQAQAQIAQLNSEALKIENNQNSQLPPAARIPNANEIQDRIAELKAKGSSDDQIRIWLKPYGVDYPNFNK